MTPLVASAFAANTGPSVLYGVAAEREHQAVFVTLEMSVGCPPPLGGHHGDR